jgi:hypothetical protein
VYEYFPDWFRSGSNELTNHIGVTKPRLFYSISKFYNLSVCTKKSHLTSFIDTYVFWIFELTTTHSKTFQCILLHGYKQTIPWHQQHCCITNKSSKTNLIYEGSSCNLCNQHNGSTTSRWDISESHHFSKKNCYVFSCLFITMKKK